MTVKVRFLDVGRAEYGDAVIANVEGTTLLVDGAHPGDQEGKGGHRSLPDQIGEFVEASEPPYEVDLLVVSHAHADHIGCLPFLVANDMLRPKWALVADPELGWGRTEERAPDASMDARVRHVVAALREEVLSPGADDADIARLLSDAADLESRYTDMLQVLAERGTRIIRHGQEDLTPLLQDFDRIGLEVIGPSDEHLRACSTAIGRATEDLIEVASDFYRRDERLTTAQAYRRLTRGGDLVDAAADRPGPAINCQSIVMSFEHGGAKVLLGGDMQWIDAEVSDPEIDDHVAALRGEVRTRAPFSVVKLSHHGSDNAFSAELLSELSATRFFAICAGERSTAHPDPSVLRLLEQHGDGITWVRTDHNRSATLTFNGSDDPEVKLERGDVNDPVPNVSDVGEGGVLPTPMGLVPGIQASQHESREFEVLTRVPAAVGRVRVTVEVDPRTGAVRPEADQLGLSAVRVGGRRREPLPRLLFVTNRRALESTLGVGEADTVLRSVQEQDLALIDDVPSEARRSTEAVAAVRDLLQDAAIEGVVILGGYNVVPSRVIDCLPLRLRARLADNADADNFLVWSDDPYGDRDGDSLPEVPVSRIPDAMSSELVFRAIQADNQSRTASPRFGIRNKLREFAEQLVYPLLPPGPDILSSAPSTFERPRFVLDADLVYLMLHGDFDDSSRYWGEEPPDFPVAVAVGNVPQDGPRVVFTGCCWGALTVEKRASRANLDLPLAQKTARASIALACLLAGATAFIGCTGSHYSPREPPYLWAGGPFHKAFWEAHRAGSAPAPALLQAKEAYMRGMPHGQTSPAMEAIGFKTMRQFTCLGLGW